MKTFTQIVIADDHPLFRQGLRQTIDADPDFRVIGEAANGHEALRLISELKPDICTLDIQMPGLDGLEIVRQLHTQKFRTEVIFLTMYKEEEMLNAALDAGVKGYVLKESAANDILDALRSATRGRGYISPVFSDFLLSRRENAAALRASKPGLHRLTPSECRILKMIAEDRTSKEIADLLGLSPRTVENHRANICAKLEVHGIHGLVKFAFDNRSRL